MLEELSVPVCRAIGAYSPTLQIDLSLIKSQYSSSKIGGSSNRYRAEL